MLMLLLHRKLLRKKAFVRMRIPHVIENLKLFPETKRNPLSVYSVDIKQN